MTRPARGAQPAEGADDPDRADAGPPVLVLRALGLGDGLTAVPALRGLRRLMPGGLLVLATAHPVARLLVRAGVVDRVLPAVGLGDNPPGLALGRHRAVNLHGRGPQSDRTLLAGRPDRLLAFACPAAGVEGPPWYDPVAGEAEHETARWCRLVEAAGGDCDPGDLRLPPPGGDAGPIGPDDRADGVSVLHPGASSGARRWPVRRWVSVARQLAAAGHRVVVTGSPAERSLVGAVARGAGLGPHADLGGRADLDALAALVARARLVLSGDTGVAHLAVAYGTPSVTLFGPTSPALWGPPAGGPHRALWHGADRLRPGDPHAARPDPRLLRITAEEVLAAVCTLPARVPGVLYPTDLNLTDARERPWPSRTALTTT